jgi:ribonuclease-3
VGAAGTVWSVRSTFFHNWERGINMSRNLKELEERIGYRFSDKHLMTQAMTHSSYANEHRLNKLECNERLEFLGDSVLELFSSDCLYSKYPNKPEGDLTKIRASIVCEPTLAYCAEELKLGEYLLLGKGEEATGGRGRASIVSDAMEALIGAIYLDGGFANAKEFILRFIMNDLEHKQLFYDSKTILQEIVQSQTEDALTYRLLREEGPDHNKLFEAQVLVGNQAIGQGTGRTKKAAEQVAAYHGILALKKDKAR